MTKQRELNRKQLLAHLKKKLKKGDLIFTGFDNRGGGVTYNVYKNLVSKIQNPKATHVGIYDGKDIVEANAATEGTAKISLAKSIDRRDSITFSSPKATTKQKLEALKYIKARIGKKNFSFKRLLGSGVQSVSTKIPIPKSFDKTDEVICSSLVADAFPKLKLPKNKDRAYLTPTDLFQNVKFKKKILIERIKNSNRFKVKG